MERSLNLRQVLAGLIVTRLEVEEDCSKEPWIYILPRVDAHTCGKAMFFKVYMAALWSERLRIPPAFIENFGRKIPRNIMLGTSSNLFWKVHINKINDYLFFEEGWPEFIQESSLAHGEFLTFSYAGGSKFYVKIFATNGCRKSVAPHRNTKYEPFKLCQGNEASRPGKSYSIEAPRGNLHGRDLAVRKSGGKCHSFEMVMTKTYIHKGLLNIPSHFDMYLKTSDFGERIATLQHKDKSWRVVVATSSNRNRFAQGWTKL
ncbi:B3 domain-containing Os03g0621600 [Olea europaea subsp. europaea]|uniref:B3 domain-containing Os03g0621600 n=3 Tax=Olea europaea subsp. europaea TaxID=158383 RepID=A0A8S0REN4_OLEEU|nr:B3 domain-containing Os03g0621600 [Olea europaea subsp. europaea]